jgi:hypothetical protein
MMMTKNKEKKVDKMRILSMHSKIKSNIIAKKYQAKTTPT